MANILVTGCARLIGSRATELLTQDGHTVISVDNLSNTYDVRLKRWRLKHLKVAENYSFEEIDICNTSKMRPGFLRNKLDSVINLAARAGVQQSVPNANFRG